MNQKYSEYLSQEDIARIQQHINDIYQEEYLTGLEYNQLFNQIADTVIHEEDDAMFTNNI